MVAKKKTRLHEYGGISVAILSGLVFHDEDKPSYLSSGNYSSLEKDFEPLYGYLREPLSTIEHKEISVYRLHGGPIYLDIG